MTGVAPATVTLHFGGELVARARIARGLWHRTRGLIGRRTLEHPDGLLIPRCSSVHSFFMRLPFDLVYVTDDLEIVKVVERLRPWRFSFGGRGARQALELPAGAAARLGLAAGQRLEAHVDQPSQPD